MAQLRQQIDSVTRGHSSSSRLAWACPPGSWARFSAIEQINSGLLRPRLDIDMVSLSLTVGQASPSWWEELQSYMAKGGDTGRGRELRPFGQSYTMYEEDSQMFITSPIFEYPLVFIFSSSFFCNHTSLRLRKLFLPLLAHGLNGADPTCLSQRLVWRGNWPKWTVLVSIPPVLVWRYPHKVPTGHSIWLFQDFFSHCY